MKYSNLGQKIRITRKNLNISQEALANKLGYTDRSTIAKIEAGKSELTLPKIKQIASILGVTPSYLMGLDDISNVEPVMFNRNVIKVPIYGEIPAGVPIEMIEDDFIEEYEDVDANLARGGKVLFGLKIKGNSMYPEFRSGDNIIFEKIADCENGAYCAVSINGTECTFKKIIKKESGITLMPLNPEFEPVFYSNQEILDLPITILGIVKEVRRTYK